MTSRVRCSVKVAVFSATQASKFLNVTTVCSAPVGVSLEKNEQAHSIEIPYLIGKTAVIILPKSEFTSPSYHTKIAMLERRQFVNFYSYGTQKQNIMESMAYMAMDTQSASAWYVLLTQRSLEFLEIVL